MGINGVASCSVAKTATLIQTNCISLKTDGLCFLGLSRGPTVDFMPRNTTINADAYRATLRRLRKAIQNCRRGKLSRGIVLIHDNARPHTARQTQTLLHDAFHWDTFDHPPYSPDLAPSDFYLFSKMKEHLACKRFTDDEDLQHAVMDWLNSQRPSGTRRE